MRRVVAAAAASGVCLAGMVVQESMDAGTGWGDVVQIVFGAGAAVAAATAWWIYRQVAAERRYDAALDAELAELEAQKPRRVTRFEDPNTARVVTLGVVDRCEEQADPRPALLRDAGGRSRILAVGGAIALVLLAVTAFRPDIGRADGGHEPETPPLVEPTGHGDFTLRYRPAGTTTKFPNGCTITYAAASVTFDGCPGTLSGLLGSVTTDQP